MLRFSELSLVQKKIIKDMRQGKVLTFKRSILMFFMTDGKFTWTVEYRTAHSLFNRGFIKQCFRDDKEVRFCVNVDINYGKYADEMMGQWSETSNHWLEK